MNLHDKIQQIIAEECFLKPADITDKALFADLGVDSLAQIQIWMRIGQEFDVEIPSPDSDFWANHAVHNLNDVLGVVGQIKQLTAGSAEASHALVRGV